MMRLTLLTMLLTMTGCGGRPTIEGVFCSDGYKQVECDSPEASYICPSPGQGDWCWEISDSDKLSSHGFPVGNSQ
jgi:hypothetical protein